MKKILAVTLFCVLVNFAHAQNKQVDSLKRLLSASLADTTRTEILVELSREYYLAKPDSGLTYAYQALALAKKTGNKRGEVRALTQVGFSIWLLGDMPTALQTYVNSLKMAADINDGWSMARNYDGMSCIYAEQNEFKTAIDYAYKSEAMFRQVHDYKNVVNVLNDITTFYAWNKKVDSALITGKKALKLSIDINETTWRSQIYAAIGAAYVQKHQNKLGLSYLHKGLNFAERNKLSFNITSTCNPLALAYRDLGNRDSCIFFAKKEFEIAKSVSLYRQMALAASILAQAYYGYDDHTSAHYYHIATAIKDSLFNDDKAKKILIINIAEQQHQADLKAAALAYQSKLKLWGIAATLILAVIILLASWRNNKRQQRANKLLETQKQQIQTALQELKATQAQLIQSEKMASLGELTAGIAHEIQNPLNFVNNFSEVSIELLAELKEEENQGNKEDVMAIAGDLTANLEKINHHGKRADAIVKGMLQHSRASAGQKELTDLNALAEEYLRLSYHGLRAKDKNFNADLITSFNPQLPRVNVLPQEIGRVILNVLNNAFYATQQKIKMAAPGYKPTIELNTNINGNLVQIAIKDNGIGIPATIKDKIMQPFFTTKPTGEGTGLGLSLSYDIVVKAHGGKIDVTTEPGEGAVFTISLPI
jgi:two-component system NtrC family sensor kinase